MEKSTPRKPLSVSGNRYRTVSKSGQRPLPFQIWDLGNIVEGAPRKIKLRTSNSAVIRSRSRTGEKDGKKEEEAVQALVLVSAA